MNIRALTQPAASTTKHRRTPSSGLIPRRLQYILVFLALPACLWFLFLYSADYAHVQKIPVSTFERGGEPPNYYEWHEREKALPQNNVDLSAPQGKEGRYLRFKNHLTNVGWGNFMQEMISHHHLAYRANRIFVMYNYTWDKHAEGDYSQFGENKIPARIPISAIVAGPLAGGRYPASDWRPPAVTTEFFELVCPNPTVVHVGDTHREAGYVEPSTATAIFDAFVARLNAIDDNCVELQEDSGQLLDFWVFGSSARMADAVPQLLRSPGVAGWGWSSLVTSIVTQNGALVYPAIDLHDASQRTELKGLLALHLRRGDFKDHCEHLAKWRFEYNAFNAQPDFPDQLQAPPGGGGGSYTDETLGWYIDHCFPDIPRIVKRVQNFLAEAKGQGRTLDRLYILTNGEREWIKELREELRKAGDWNSIATSRDLDIDWEQEFVKQAADMLIATRAEVFVGNAWSSLSSNVNLLRIAQNHEPETSRFW
ncbi:hypothetical protein PENSPDRAFT_747623 [Peniophora sp. CONT]|nr:hypothetical protein PENSPDRAFT_747623 [Peniophora sp. CONT]